MAETPVEQTWEINGCIISAQDILGRGAYGVVYKGKDSQNRTIAAKTVNGQIHPRILNQNFDRLLKLKHPNIVNIFQKFQQGDEFWMFIEYCPHGDLNQFFHTRTVSHNRKLDVMVQMMTGVEYLHKNNIVHRDIKPGNILIFHESPLLLKLTDFDVSKFLNPEVETSEMSSNVGTFAYKAPEFFRRNSMGKISYYRSVNVYASGLTYLAILQGRKGKRMLMPCLETAEDPSELITPIASTIVTRLRYGVKELNIVKLEDATNANKPNATEENKIRELIKSMTNIEPRNRLSATKVIGKLLMIQGQAELVYEHSTQLQDRKEPEGYSVEVSSKIAEPKPHSIYEMQFYKVKTWKAGMRIWAMRVNIKDQLLLRGWLDEKGFIKIIDKNTGCTANAFPSLCNHFQYCRVNEHPTNPEFVVEACTMCDAVRAYNLNTSQGHRVYVGCKPFQICSGPPGTVLIIDIEHRILQLRWSEEKQKFHLDCAVQTNAKSVWEMRYAKGRYIVIIISRSPGHIEAVSLNDGSTLWEHEGTINGEKIHPTAVTCDTFGRVYVSDCGKEWLLVLDCETGALLQELSLEERMGYVLDVCWTKNQPQLIVRHGAEMITCYKTKTYHIIDVPQKQ